MRDSGAEKRVFGPDKESPSSQKGEVTDKLYKIFTQTNFTPIRPKRTPKRKNEDSDINNQSSNKSRLRTPSGQVISTTVGDRKLMLGVSSSQKVVKQNMQLNNRVSAELNSIEDRRCERENNTDPLTPSDLFSEAYGQTQQVLKLMYQNQGGLITLGEMQPIKEKRCEDTDQSGSPIKEDDVIEGVKLTDQPSLAKVLFEDGNQKKGAIAESINNSIKEMEDGIPGQCGEPNPTMMDVRTVLKMLEELKIDIKEQINTMSDNKPELEIARLNSRIGIYEAKERMMIGTMSSMADKIKELQNRVEQQEINNAKKTFIIAGLETSEKKHICRKQVRWFIYDTMQVDVNIDDAYKMGAATPREIVVTVANVAEKHEIFNNISKIKNLVNSAGKKYYFRDFYVPSVQENRKK